MRKYQLLLIIMGMIVSCTNGKRKQSSSNDRLNVKKGDKIITYQNGDPFLWLGCTAWGMTEWLSREDVDFYLDDRKKQRF